MITLKPVRIVLSFCALAVAAAACSSKDDKPADVSVLQQNEGVLMYVPADTPYVFASPGAMPEDVLDKLEANSDSIFGAYETVIKETMNAMAAEDDGEMTEEERNIITLIGDLAGMMRSDELRAAGVPRSPQMAIYGVGLLPVIRLELADPDAFDNKISAVIEDSGVEMMDGEIDGNDYRYVGDDEARLIIAVIGDQAVAAIVPTALADEQLKPILGIDRPSQSIAESGALSELAQTYDYGPYGLGFFDVERFASTFVDTASGVNAELLALMEYDASTLTDVCRDEIREASRIMPRIVTGYNEVSTERLTSNTVMEIRDDLARGLMALSVPVPGMGMDHGGFGSFGMSLDLLAAREFYEARLTALEADPYKCEYFAEFQAGVAQGREAMNQPLPPIVYGFKGFVAVIDDIGDIDFASQSPPEDVDARILVANDNAEGLLAMGAMFSPELGALQVQPDGKAVELDVPQFTAGLGSAYVAMTEGTLGVAVGEGASGRIENLLASTPADPPPFMSMSLDGARYYQLMSDVLEASAQDTAASGGPGAASPEMQAAMSQIMTGVGDMVERITVDMTFTERGLELPSTVTLAD